MPTKSNDNVEEKIVLGAAGLFATGVGSSALYDALSTLIRDGGKITSTSTTAFVCAGVTLVVGGVCIVNSLLRK